MDNLFVGKKEKGKMADGNQMDRGLSTSGAAFRGCGCALRGPQGISGNPPSANVETMPKKENSVQS